MGGTLGYIVRYIVEGRLGDIVRYIMGGTFGDIVSYIVGGTLGDISRLARLLYHPSLKSKTQELHI